MVSFCDGGWVRDLVGALSFTRGVVIASLSRWTCRLAFSILSLLSSSDLTSLALPICIEDVYIPAA